MLCLFHCSPHPKLQRLSIPSMNHHWSSSILKLCVLHDLCIYRPVQNLIPWMAPNRWMAIWEVDFLYFLLRYSPMRVRCQRRNENKKKMKVSKSTGCDVWFPYGHPGFSCILSCWVELSDSRDARHAASKSLANLDANHLGDVNLC